MKFEDGEIIDSNGTKYLVGWDEYGWFSIMHIDIYPPEEVTALPLAEYNGKDYAYEPVGEYPTHSFLPDGAERIKDIIEERP